MRPLKPRDVWAIRFFLDEDRRLRLPNEPRFKRSRGAEPLRNCRRPKALRGRAYFEHENEWCQRCFLKANNPIPIGSRAIRRFEYCNWTVYADELLLWLNVTIY